MDCSIIQGLLVNLLELKILFMCGSFNEILSTIKPMPLRHSLTKPYLLTRKIKSSLEHLGHTKQRIEKKFQLLDDLEGS